MTTAAYSPSSGGYVTNEVIALQLKHLTDEIQLLRREGIRRDVYDEQRRADQMELAQVKEQLSSAQNRKWAVWLAVIVASIALGKDILVSLAQSAS